MILDLLVAASSRSQTQRLNSLQPPPPPPQPAQEFAQDCQFATSMALQSSKPP